MSRLRIQDRKRPRHKWHDKNRVILLMLKKLYGRKDITAIWNFIFQKQLVSEGFCGGIPATSLDGQIQEIKNGGRGFHFYTQIVGATVKEIDLMFPGYWEEIQAAAAALDLNVIRSISTTNVQSRRQITKRRREASRGSVPRESPIDHSSELHGTSNEVRTELQSFAFQPSPYFTPQSLTLQEEPHNHTQFQPGPSMTTNSATSVVKKGHGHPELLFRSTQTIATYRSRWLDAGRKLIYPPPSAGTDAFRALAIPHLQRSRKWPSPYLSLSSNPAVALNKVEAARSEEIDEKRFLVIFRYEDLARNAFELYGQHSGPYHVRKSLPAEDFLRLPKGYTGPSEFLVYGQITCEPIAVLESFHAVNLAYALRLLKLGDTESLLKIHECLKPIADEWKEELACRFLQAGHCKRYITHPGSRDYKLVMNVICLGGTRHLREYREKSLPIAADEPEDESNEPEDFMPEPSFSDEAFSHAVQENPVAIRSPVQILPSNKCGLSKSQRAKNLTRSWNVVQDLNNISSAKRANPTSERAKARIGGSTPFWSPSHSPSPDVYRSASKTLNDHQKQAKNTKDIDMGSKWDFLDDLDFNFAEGLDSAFARKVTRVPALPLDCDEPMPSIEETPTPDTRY